MSGWMRTAEKSKSETDFKVSLTRVKSCSDWTKPLLDFPVSDFSVSPETSPLHVRSMNFFDFTVRY